MADECVRASSLPARADVQGHPIYGPVFGACGALVSGECERLDVKSPLLDFHTDEDEEVECGAVHLPVVQ